MKRCIVWLFFLFFLPTVEAVEYSLPDLQGRMQSLEQYRGKWLIVNYWASWCQSCIKELPELNALHDKLKSHNVAVVGINFESLDASALKQAVQQVNIKYTVLHSEPVRNTPLGPVPALPTTYIINPEGVLVAGQVGVITRENIESYLESKGLVLDRI